MIELPNNYALFKIPMKLVSEANKSGHWSKHSKRHKQQKWLVTSFMAHYYPDKNLPCHVKMVRHSPRLLDTFENLPMSFKYVVDAISEYLTDIKRAGMADRDPRITWECSQEKTTDKEHYITIEICSEGS